MALLFPAEKGLVLLGGKLFLTVPNAPGYCRGAVATPNADEAPIVEVPSNAYCSRGYGRAS